MNFQKKNNPLVPLIFTVFLDLVGVGIAAPIIALLFLDPSSGILPVGISISQRTFFLGILIASYPLAQFIGAPILGALSDTYGRKRLLILSLAGTAIGYLLFSIGIVTKNLPLLFLGRIIDGITGGNISIANSAIADISTPETKPKNFGLVGMAFGFGFIIGPYLGGKLSDSSIVPWFSSATPFLVAALLSLLNILLFVFLFHETHAPKKEREPLRRLATRGMRNLGLAWKREDLRRDFAVVFLFVFGFSFFTQFVQVFLYERFSFNESKIGDFFAYIGICVAIVQGVLIRPVSKRFKPEQVIQLTLLSLSASLFAISLVTNPVILYFVIPFVALSNGLTQPNITSMISNSASKESQGEILGIQQSLSSVAIAIPPIISGIVAGENYVLPIYFASGTVFFAWLFFVLSRKAPAHSGRT